MKVADAASPKPAAKADTKKPKPAAAANAAKREADSKRRVWRGGSSSGQSWTQERPASASKGAEKGNGKGANARTWGNKKPPSEARDAARSPSRGNRSSRKEAAKPASAATVAAQQQQQQRSLPQRSEAATQRSRSSGQPLNRQRRDAEDEVEVRVWRPSYVPEAKSASRRARTPEVSSSMRATTPDRSRRKQDASKRSQSVTGQEKLPEMGWSPSWEVGRSWGSSGAAEAAKARSTTPDRATAARAATGRASSRSRASKPASFNARVPRPAG